MCPQHDASPTLLSRDYKDPCIVAFSIEPGAASRLDPQSRINENISPTLRANSGDNHPAVAYAVENHPADSRVQLRDDGVVQTLTQRMGTGGGNVPLVLRDGKCFWDGGQVAQTLTVQNAGGNQRMPDKQNMMHVVEKSGNRYVIRKLTPLECCRLQGFPDWYE